MTINNKPFFAYLGCFTLHFGITEHLIIFWPVKNVMARAPDKNSNLLIPISLQFDGLSIQNL